MIRYTVKCDRCKHTVKSETHLVEGWLHLECFDPAQNAILEWHLCPECNADFYQFISVKLPAA